MSAFGKVFFIRGEYGSFDGNTGETQVFIIRLICTGEVMGQENDLIHHGSGPLVEIFFADPQYPSLAGYGKLLATFKASQIERLEFDLPLIFIDGDKRLVIPMNSIFDMQKWVNLQVNPSSLLLDVDEDTHCTSRRV